MSTGGSERRCLVCGRSRQVDEHHVAAGTNDQGFVRQLCEACHRDLTGWQWRLGILNRETGREDAPKPTDLQRAWALTEGTVLLSLLLDSGGTASTALALGRASGVTARMVADLEESNRPLGPTPAWGRREAQDARPTGRGLGDSEALLDLGLEAAARLGPEMDLHDARAELPRALEWLRWLDAAEIPPSDLATQAAAVEGALARIAAAASLERLLADPEALETLARAARTSLRLLAAVGAAATEAEALDAVAEALH